jgi:hypothetical protein
MKRMRVHPPGVGRNDENKPAILTAKRRVSARSCRHKNLRINQIFTGGGNRLANKDPSP